MSAPKFTVSSVLYGDFWSYEVKRDGEIVASFDDHDLARVIESHAGLVEALKAALPLIDGLTNAHTKALARAALAKARGEAQQ